MEFTPRYFTEQEKTNARLKREDVQSKEIDPVFNKPIDEEMIAERKNQ